MSTVPSEYVRRSMVRELGVDGERIVVVPHGYEPDLLVERTDPTELRRRFALGDGPVLVYPAMTAPHKNHVFLVELLETVWREPELRLVLIGGAGLAAEALDQAIAAASESTRSRIVRPGRVSDADRNGLIAMADALVFPSTYEGFGAPLIEAMALGTPVLCSNATCLPDIAGDAAVVRPLLAESWESGLDEVAAAATSSSPPGASGWPSTPRAARARRCSPCSASRTRARGGLIVVVPLRIAVLCPHFAPDNAPTGTVMTRIVHELAADTSCTW
ncbi:MAG: glycosyltransferase family 1 protein [Ilumatobacteraceae bacterium]